MSKPLEESIPPSSYSAAVPVELVVLLGSIVVALGGLVGLFFSALWIADRSPVNAVAVLMSAILISVGLATVALGKLGYRTSASCMLVGGLLVVISAASLVSGVPLVSAAYLVLIVLAGVFLRRAAVLAVAGLVGLLVLLEQTFLGIDSGLLMYSSMDAKYANMASLLGLVIILALVTVESVRRFEAVISQSEARAKDAEQRARELEEAKREIERRAVDLAMAKREIEENREIMLGVAEDIHAMSKDLAATSSQQASGSTEQAAAMSEIVAAMEELSRAASQIASNSAQVSHLTVTARHAAGMGREAVENTIAGLDRIRGEVRSVAEKNLALGQKTQAIGEIIEIISEIADRTHLLALNAAIESAAAGEYGRRFSVVASQVKELANESKAAAHQVRAAVVEIQRAAGSTVLAVEKSEADVEVGAGLGRGAGDAISQIVEAVEQVAVATREMLLATQQQQSASEQVVSTVRQIEQVTRQSADSGRYIAQAVSQLVSTAERLHGVS